MTSDLEWTILYLDVCDEDPRQQGLGVDQLPQERDQDQGEGLGEGLVGEDLDTLGDEDIIGETVQELQQVPGQELVLNHLEDLPHGRLSEGRSPRGLHPGAPDCGRHGTVELVEAGANLVEEYRGEVVGLHRPLARPRLPPPLRLVAHQVSPEAGKYFRKLR